MIRDASAIGAEIARALVALDAAGSEETIAHARGRLADAMGAVTHYADRSIEEWKRAEAEELEAERVGFAS